MFTTICLDFLAIMGKPASAKAFIYAYLVGHASSNCNGASPEPMIWVWRAPLE